MTLAAFLALATVQLMAAISPGPAVLMTAREGGGRPIPPSRDYQDARHQDQSVTHPAI